ncbi:MAG: polysaccharide deacetylase family protein [Phycisphaerales bacterium]|nr:MAG: polysaccharide deacetylase family protein [Phycisphaerales bacterium]
MALSLVMCAIALLTGCVSNRLGRPAGVRPPCPWTLDQGAVVRGDVAEKRIALIFTGGEHGDGSEHILDTLKRAGIKASFFVTGHYVANEEHHPFLRRMVAEGHYLGPHSDSHPLYCSWEDRSRTLVTESFFRSDLQKNIEALRGFGALDGTGPTYFIPPYEWFNEAQVRWARDMGIVLFNFTPGSGSNRDWIPEGHAGFVSSRRILSDILAYDRKDPHGLNGFLLLLHLGSLREDKTYLLLGTLIDELARRGYRYVRVDEMLKQAGEHRL